MEVPDIVAGAAEEVRGDTAGSAAAAAAAADVGVLVVVVAVAFVENAIAVVVLCTSGLWWRCRLRLEL